MTYEEGVLKAYEGELIGEQLYAALAHAALQPNAQQGYAAIAAVERVTNRLLHPVVVRLGLSPVAERIDGALARRTPELAALTWAQFVERAMTDWPPYVPQFETIRDLAPPGDRVTLDMLVEHERALVDFAERENAGKNDSLQSLNRYLDRAQALLVRQPDIGSIRSLT